MSTHTITTAARRIAREVNETPTTLEIRFNADGSVYSVNPKGLWPAEGPDVYFLRLQGRKGQTALSQARAQLLIDTMAEAIEKTDDAASARLLAEDLVHEADFEAGR
ncbi:hypothetical protein J2Y69_003325 [Microbacterium resistens]|uniref:Uncharacterized protein n=1 Tax=Microbacterium resistens TaxID=156977 RepID=A0ABU1SGI6_9MICO|nr:hypothetical protein [Microbacterium resistens]MDR6868701.1 hypothetical protein [Microbacterium resistens]